MLLTFLRWAVIISAALFIIFLVLSIIASKGGK